MTNRNQESRIKAMTTIKDISNSITQSINEYIIDGLVDVGYTHEMALKVVTEFDGFDYIQDSIDHPAIDWDF